MRLLTITIMAAALALTAEAAERHKGGRTFSHRVVSTPSVVYLKGFHTATQRGPTCNVYSTWMILRYYKFHITPTQIKKGSKNGEYKTSKFIEEKLDAVNFCFLVYHPKQGTDFGDVVKVCIDNGIPLQWGVNLKYAPNAKAPTRNTRDAGHARVIWGYERDRHTGEVKKIIFADSWGRKALRQKIDVDEACHMTMSMSPVFPNDTDRKVVAKLLAIPGMQQGDIKVPPEDAIDRKPDKTPDRPSGKKHEKKKRRKKKGTDD